MTNESLQLARQLLLLGVSPIPIVRGTKRPAIAWKRYQHQGPGQGDLSGLFARTAQLTVGVLTGEPSDRLAVIDCDNMRTLDRMLHELGTPLTWIVQSPRGGHIYLRTPSVVRSTRGDGFDVKAARAYVLAAGAFHPSGVRYTWLQQARTIAEWPTFEFPGIQLHIAPSCPADIPRIAWRLLRGEGIEHYKSRSEVDAAIVLTFVNAGFDFERTFEAFRKHDRSKFSELYRDDPSGATRYLRHTYEEANAFASAHDSSGRAAARGQILIASSIAWPGLTGATDRAVFLAHAKIAFKAGSTTQYAAGVRELAEQAGVNKLTAARANKRLTAQQMIRPVQAHTATFSTRWELLGASRDAYTPKEITNMRECTTPETGHDVFRRAGFGPGAGQAWRLLLNGPRTIAELVKLTGRCKATIWRGLTHMESVGMVKRDRTDCGLVWHIVEGVNLDEIARAIGTYGLGARQASLHRRERQTHRAVLALGQSRRNERRYVGEKG